MIGTEGTAARTGTGVVYAEDVVRVYGEGDTEVRALRGVGVQIDPGQLTAVMGPSGSGKSTLMHILAGLDRPTEGEVWIDSTEIGSLADTELTKLRRTHVGFIFQFFNLLPMLSARDNIVLPLTIAGTKPDPQFFEDLVERVGLADRLEHRPAELSGGQQQRVAIARAFAGRPRAMLLDEVTSALDPELVGEVLAAIRDLKAEGVTMLLVTHEMTFAREVADRIGFLHDGRIVEIGPPERVLSQPERPETQRFLRRLLEAGRI